MTVPPPSPADYAAHNADEALRLIKELDKRLTGLTAAYKMLETRHTNLFNDYLHHKVNHK